PSLVVERDFRINNVVERINNSVARDINIISSNSLAQQVVSGYRSRRKVQGSQLSCKFPIGFFGEWRENIERTKPSFGVHDRNTTVESSDRTSRGGCCVTLYDHCVWGNFVQDSIQSHQGLGHDSIQCLSWLDNIQVMSGCDAEEFIDLIQHLAMLTCHCDYWV